MNSIQIDDQVFAELSRRATGFHVTPNDVLRRILNLQTPSSPQALATPLAANQTPPAIPVAATLLEFIRSERFQRHHQTIDRFLVILGWLHSAHPKEFADAALGFRRGKRLYFAKSEQEILQSGDGTTAKPIPQSPFWALTTLDNKSKRIVLEDVLRALGYPLGDINLVLAELPDSGIRRSHGQARLLQSL
jgi:negative modulator of initiation of replication